MFAIGKVLASISSTLQNVEINKLNKLRLIYVTEKHTIKKGLLYPSMI